ncbi:ABC transporter substrate-binding protein [Caenispirillum bisanense]|uniref:ABC transporter substrate-binding protein n=1 Tax=Caenispirillum bisanense TaxID=414052 RepID=UPI0031D8DD1A
MVRIVPDRDRRPRAARHLSDFRRYVARSAVALALGLAPVTATTAAAAEAVTIRIAYLTQEDRPQTPVTFLEPVLTDAGLQGARLGVADNDSTGRFTGQRFELVEAVVPRDGSVAEAAQALAADGIRFIVADLPRSPLREVAALTDMAEALIFNTRAPDDSLRNDECAANLLHVTPSRRMLADALGQYLVWKKWTRWAVIAGPTPEDAAYAEAVQRAATRFGATVVERRDWTFDIGHRRVDTGHVTIQSEVPTATQLPDHDVLIVADEHDRFGEYLAYRTWQPRPVAGTHGLVPTAWARVHEQWGATQLHSRFEKAAGRWMTARDYTAWAAVRAIGEAATRAGSADPAAIAAFLRGDDFSLAAFKGEALTFREWDGQLRQPVLLAGPRMLISVSPQDGFLHQGSLLDTLGDDRPETRCRL